MQFVIGYILICAVGFCLLWLWTLITDHKLQIVSFFTSSASDFASFVANVAGIILCFIFICVLCIYISSILNFLGNAIKRNCKTLYKQYQQDKCEEEKRKIDDLYKQALKLKDKNQYQYALSVIDKAIELSEKQGYDVTGFDCLKDEILYLITGKKQNLTEKVNRLYNESLNCKWSKDYEQAFDYINEALKIAQEENIDTSRLIKFKDELSECVNSTYIAENNIQDTSHTNENKDSSPQPSTTKPVKKSPEDTRVKKQAEKFEGYGMFNDEYDEYVPQNIAEAIARKMSGQELKNTIDDNYKILKYSNNEQNTIDEAKQKQVDNFINLAKGFMEIKSYEEAWEYILKIEKALDNDTEHIKEVLKQLGEESSTLVFQSKLKQMLSTEEPASAFKRINELLTVSSTAQILIKNTDDDFLLRVFEPANSKMLAENNYQLLISQLNLFINLRPPALKIKKRLERVEAIYDNYKEFIESYEAVKEMYQKGDYDIALTKIRFIIEDAKKENIGIQNFKILEEEILCEIQKKRDGTNYKNMLTRYAKNPNFNFKTAMSSLEGMIRRNPKKEYIEFLKKLEIDYNNKLAQESYIKSRQYYENRDYNIALSNIRQALNYAPDNSTYIELKNTIEKIIEEERKNEEFARLYNSALQAYKDASFDNAIDKLEEAISLKPDDFECIKLMGKAKSKKIDITICTQNALLTLDFINEEQAENIIQTRNNGEMWYDYQKFAEQFEIMPHLWADVEEKIEFPLKQANKAGRRIDF